MYIFQFKSRDVHTFLTKSVTHTNHSFIQLKACSGSSLIKTNLKRLMQSETERAWGALNVLSISCSRSIVWSERSRNRTDPKQIKQVCCFYKARDVRTGTKFFIVIFFKALHRLSQKISLWKQWIGLWCKKAFSSLVATLSQMLPFSSTSISSFVTAFILATIHSYIMCVVHCLQH